jgi:hypothetical protein
MKPTSRQLLGAVRQLGTLDWRTLLAGFDRGLIGGKEVIDEAVHALATSFAEPPVALVSLAGADGESQEHIRSLLSELASMESPDPELRERDRWRLAMLSFIREHESDHEVLLREVAEVYAIFDYPPDMQAAIYYMPVASTKPVRLGDQLPSPLEAIDALIRSLRARLTAPPQDQR